VARSTTSIVKTSESGAGPGCRGGGASGDLAWTGVEAARGGRPSNNEEAPTAGGGPAGGGGFFFLVYTFPKRGPAGGGPVGGGWFCSLKDIGCKAGSGVYRHGRRSS
jgi:hypothetical protein